MHSKKTRLSGLGDGNAIKLAKARHHTMPQYVAITKAFPLPINKEELAWGCLVKAAQGHEEMMAELESLEGNSSLKSSLIDYVSTHLPTMHFLTFYTLRYGVLGHN